uniref:Uncharacterized protein n=1 Tax=Solanum tuberosum TaxID=4113 RepID=M1A3E2_SOLTU
MLVRGRTLTVAQGHAQPVSPNIYDILDNETIPSGFIAMLVLQDTLVDMLGFLEGWCR